MLVDILCADLTKAREESLDGGTKRKVTSVSSNKNVKTISQNVSLTVICPH